MDSSQRDSAFIYFDAARSYYLTTNDTLKIASCMLNMAILANEAGDQIGTQEILVESSKYLNHNNPKHHPFLLSFYNTLGTSSNELGNAEEAINYFQEALKFTDNTTKKNIALNNLANSYRLKGAYNVSIKIYEELLSTQSDSLEYARSLSNLAYVKWLDNPKYNAANNLLKALELRLKFNDRQGLIASYKHLSLFYENRNKQTAERFAKKMLTVADQLNNSKDKSEALLKLAALSGPQNANIYYQNYTKLSDSLHQEQIRNKNQFALIRYEAEKHKAQKIQLEKDNIEKNNRIKVQTIFLIAVIIVSLLAIMIGWQWLKRRNLKMEANAMQQIKQSQLRTSKKVHDIVANGLYRLMNIIENDGKIEKGQLLDHIEDMYEKSRNISYEEVNYKNENFKAKLGRLIRNFSSVSTKVVTLGNDHKIWREVPRATLYELEHIIQELLVNMKKHSQATQVLLKFDRKESSFKIEYSDNGVGFPKERVYKNGLTNTVNRIHAIGANINFDQTEKDGVHISIYFDLKK